MNEVTIFGMVEVHDITDERILTLEKEKEGLIKRMEELEKKIKKEMKI